MGSVGSFIKVGLSLWLLSLSRHVGDGKGWVQGERTNTPWVSSGAEGGSGYTWAGAGFLPEWRGSQGFCDSDFRSRGDQTRPGHSLLFLVLVPVLVVEDVLLLLVIGYLDGWCQASGKFLSPQSLAFRDKEKVLELPPCRRQAEVIQPHPHSCRACPIPAEHAPGRTFLAAQSF